MLRAATLAQEEHCHVPYSSGNIDRIRGSGLRRRGARIGNRDRHRINRLEFVERHR